MNVPSGYSALDLVGFTDKGDYLPSATYVKNDLVHYNDKIWKCLIDDTTGIVPTTGLNWDIWIDQSNSLNGLADVEITNPTDGQELSYDATTQKWKNTSKIQSLTNEVKDMNNVLGAKNLLPYPYYNTTNVNNGVTFTDNGDGTITVNGTATSNTPFVFNDKAGIIPEGTYKCTTEGWSGDSTIDWWYLHNRTTGQDIASPFKGNTFTYNGTDVLYFRYYVKAGKTVSNLTLKPMIRLASIEDATFEPYTKTNQQLTEDTTALLDNLEVNGAVNMLPCTHTTNVLDGITLTVNDDGSLVFSGTSTKASGYSYFNGTFFTLKKGTYKISKTIANATMYLANSGGTSVITASDSEDKIFTLSADTEVRLVVRVAAGLAVSGTIYPMLTVPSYNGDYVPYAKSNKELTEDVADISDVVDITNNVKITSQSYLSQTYAYVKNGILDLWWVSAETLTANAETVVGQLPSGYRPLKLILLPLSINGKIYDDCYAKLQTDGSIIFYIGATSAQYYGTKATLFVG